MSEERDTSSRRPRHLFQCGGCWCDAPPEPCSQRAPYINTHQWSVPSSLSLVESVFEESDVFVCGEEEWRMSATLFQLRQQGALHSYLCITLDWIASCLDPSELFAHFKLYIRNEKNAALAVKQRCTHRFVSYLPSGFTLFIPLEQILDRPLAQTAESGFSVTFRLRDKAHPQGKAPAVRFATYGFSVLAIFGVAIRYLYHIQSLREAVMEVDPETDREGAELLIAVRKVFKDIESDMCDPIDIMIVFRAYGSQLTDLGKVFEFWEFFHYFSWRLGAYWSQASDSPLHSLFVGTYLHYFEKLCAAHLREFDMLQLDTMRASGFYDALNNACTLDEAGQPIKADPPQNNIQRSTQFSSFPPVLRLILKRFKYDAFQRKDVKLLHFFDFPDRLSLDHSSFHFLSDTAKEAHYQLTTIIAHEGNTLKTGYYVIYIRLDDARWWKFAESISQMSQAQVMESCGRSACVLSYTRTQDWNWIMHSAE